MFAYIDKTNQIAMLSKGKINAPNFTELEVDETDQAIVNQQTKGGQLSVKNGKIEYTPIQTAPTDIVAEINDALATSKDFADFKKTLADRLTK